MTKQFTSLDIRKCWRRAGSVVVLACVGYVWGTNGRVFAQDSTSGSQPGSIQREIERQRPRLDSIEVEERRDALMRLGSFRRPEASRVAAKALTDPVPIVRVAAAHAVVSLPGDEAAGLLLPLLQDKVEFVRQEAAYALGETHSRTAVQALVETLLGDKMNSPRGAAAVALGLIGDESAVVALAQVLTAGSQAEGANGKSKKVRGDAFGQRAAARSLGQIKNRAATPALVAALSNERNDNDVRREAAIALGVIGDRAATPALQAAVASNDPYLARVARESLQMLSGTKE